MMVVLFFQLDSLAFAQTEYELFNFTGETHGDFLFPVLPAFEDDRCMDDLEGVYWAEPEEERNILGVNYLQRRTVYIRKKSKGILTSDEIFHNRLEESPEQINHFVEESHQDIVLGETLSEDGKHNQVYCLNGRFLVMATTTFDVVKLSTFGFPSTQFRYHVWWKEENPDGTYKLRREFSGEEVYHTQLSPFKIKPDDFEREKAQSRPDVEILPIDLLSPLPDGYQKGTPPAKRFYVKTVDRTYDEVPFLLLHIFLIGKNQSMFETPIGFRHPSKGGRTIYNSRVKLIKEEVERANKGLPGYDTPGRIDPLEEHFKNRKNKPQNNKEQTVPKT